METLGIGRVTLPNLGSQNPVRTYIVDRTGESKIKKEVNYRNFIDLVPDLVRDITFDSLYLTFEVIGMRNCFCYCMMLFAQFKLQEYIL